MLAILATSLHTACVPNRECLGRSANSCWRRTNAVGWEGMQMHIDDPFGWDFLRSPRRGKEQAKNNQVANAHLRKRIAVRSWS